MPQQSEIVLLAWKAGARGHACPTCLVAWAGRRPCWVCGGPGVDRHGATS